MVVNLAIRLVAVLSNLIWRRINSAEGVGGLALVQNGILYFMLGRYREQDPFQQDIEEEPNPFIYVVRILSGLTMFSMVFGMTIMARSSAERIVDAEALMLLGGHDTVLTGDHENLIREMRNGGRAG